MEAWFKMTVIKFYLAMLRCVIWKDDKRKVNWQEYERKRLLLCMRRYLGVCVEGLKNTTEDNIQVRWSSGRNLNMRLPVY
jgi:hypothetical protein